MHIASEERVWTIAALLEWSREYLSGHGIDDARLTPNCSSAGCSTAGESIFI
jgi:hypothetical protein